MCEMLRGLRYVVYTAHINCQVMCSVSLTNLSSVPWELQLNQTSHYFTVSRRRSSQQTDFGPMLGDVGPALRRWANINSSLV